MKTEEIKSLASEQPYVIIVVGLLGSGSEALAKRISKVLNIPFIDKDGGFYYGEEDEKALFFYRTVMGKKSFVLDGYLCIWRDSRIEKAHRYKRAGYRVIFIYFENNHDVCFEKAKITKPWIVDKADWFRSTSDSYAPPLKNYEHVILKVRRPKNHVDT